MMYKRKGVAQHICVLAISTQIFELPGVVITDQNAAGNYVRFYTPKELAILPFDWIIECKYKSAKCAEVLVPDVIMPAYIEKAYVVNFEIKDNLVRYGFDENRVSINPDLFFG